MKNCCDLHTHSVYSDGTFTPAQLIDEALRLGLGAIALTDHNTVAGLPEFLAAAKDKDIEAIPGIEFSTEWQGMELHLLALYIRPEHFAAITDRMDEFLARRQACCRLLVENLSRAGFDLDYDAIKAKTTKQVNRAHVAMAMVEKGYIQTRQEAFERFLEPRHGYYTPPKRMTPLEAVTWTRQMGAVPVLAHPYLQLDDAQLEALLTQLVPAGLAGMEVLYSTYDDATTRAAARMADRFGIIASGGSDFHGGNKPDIAIGTGKGNLQIPLETAHHFRQFFA